MVFIDLSSAPLYLKKIPIAPGVPALPMLLAIAIFKTFYDLYLIFSDEPTLGLRLSPGEL